LCHPKGDEEVNQENQKKMLMKTLDITDGFFKDQPLSQEKNNAMISLFICRNFCKSQLIAIQPLDFSQVLSKKRRIFFF
jgi:hypothetical protein